MEQFTTYAKENCNFFFKMDDYSGTYFDNKEALNLRVSLVLVESGSGIAQLNDKPVPYIAPCVFCVSENEHLVISEDKDNKIRAIFLHPSVINSTLDFETTKVLPPDAPLTLVQDKDLLRLFFIRENDYIGKFNLGPLSAKKFSAILDSFHELIMEQKYYNWACRSRSYLMMLLFLLENLYSAGYYSNEKILGEVEEKIHPILLYIYHNYDKKITVADITSKFYISRTTLSRLFQDNIGDTCLTYINKLRITMASTILRDTLLPINEVMNKVGFTDTVHFLRTFKKYTGYTPSDYRDRFECL